MNHFRWVNTTVSVAELDFSRLNGASKYSGEVTLAAAFGIPKNLAENKKVICELELTTGSETEKMSVHAKSKTCFEMVDPICAETLENDVQTYCYPFAAGELKRRLSEITKLQIGAPMDFPIPPVGE